MKSKTHNWETLNESFHGDYKIFKVKKMSRRHPVMDKKGDFVVLESPGWVNIIPVTIENKIVMVEQYRHGIDKITMEIPGGLVDSNESYREAAERECIEETGYSGSGNAILLGENYPNPAFLNNTCQSFVWFGCTKKENQNLDKNEDINVIEVPFYDLKNLIMSQKIEHSLVLTAFFFFSLKYGL